MVNRGAVVNGLVESVLLLRHGGVVDVDESISGAREEDRVVAGMKLKLYAASANGGKGSPRGIDTSVTSSL